MKSMFKTSAGSTITHKVEVSPDCLLLAVKDRNDWPSLKLFSFSKGVITDSQKELALANLRI